MKDIGSPKESDFAASLERSGNKALEWASAYMEKMQGMMTRELGSTKVSTEEDLMDYVRARDDPQTLRQAYLAPLEQRFGKGKGREAFLKYVKQMEAKLMRPLG